MEVKMNADSNDVQLAMMQTFDALGVLHSNSGPYNLNRSTFNKGGFLYGVNCSRDGFTGANYNNSIFDASNLSIKGTFDVGTTVPYTLIVFACYNSASLEINKFLTPITTW